MPETTTTCKSVLKRLKAIGNPMDAAGMARFGIETRNALGISVIHLRKLACEIGCNHELALELWKSGAHEARILAALVDDPKQVTEDQMERWVKGFDSWDVCDQCCGALFDKTPHAYRKALEWSRREEEFVKRAAFSLMANLAAHDKEADDQKFLRFLPAIRRESNDPRNFVKKAVNWALRQTGKRTMNLNRAAIDAAYEIRLDDSPSARWIAADALRELTSDAVQRRLIRK